MTGNASGSYTFSRWKAEECICHNMELLNEVLEAFGIDMKVTEMDAERCDVWIRCHLLGKALSEVVSELYSE